MNRRGAGFALYLLVGASLALAVTLAVHLGAAVWSFTTGADPVAVVEAVRPVSLVAVLVVLVVALDRVAPRVVEAVLGPADVQVDRGEGVETDGGRRLVEGEVGQVLGPDDVGRYHLGRDLSERVVGGEEAVVVVYTRERTLAERVLAFVPFVDNRAEEWAPVVVVDAERAADLSPGDPLSVEVAPATVTRRITGTFEEVST